jgi:Flp pilus assembly protein TadB
MIHVLLLAFIILCVVGVILWGINQIPGIPPIIKTVIYVVVAVMLLIWLYNMADSGSLGMGHSLSVR